MEAIQQSKDFKSNYERCIVNVQYTASWLNNSSSDLMSEFDLTMQQYNILRILKGQHPKATTVKMLIERMLDKSSNASRIVDKLVKKKLVERNQCPNDRRQVDVLITENGIKLLHMATKKIDSELNASPTLSEKDAALLSDLLDKLRG